MKNVMAHRRARRSLYDADSSSDRSGNESVLTELVDSDDDGMAPLRLNSEDFPRSHSTMVRLAQRVQEACAAAGQTQNGTAISPELNPLRQLQLHEPVRARPLQQLQGNQQENRAPNRVLNQILGNKQENRVLNQIPVNQQANRILNQIHVNQQANQVLNQLPVNQQENRLLHQLQVNLQGQGVLQPIHGVLQPVHLDQQGDLQERPVHQMGEDADDQENIPVDAQGRPLRYECRSCPARFTYHNLMTKHAAEVHAVLKPFPCPGCGRSYASRDVMEAHFLMVHQGERPFPCDSCDKVFSRREYLQTHSRVHTGVRPYGCMECGKRFAWRGSYDYHRRTHTGERPYVCMTCSRDFTGSSTLKMHEMIHTNTFPFPCTQCERKFRRRYDLKDHALYHMRDQDVDAGEVSDQDQEILGIGDDVVTRAEEEAAVQAVVEAVQVA